VKYCEKNNLTESFCNEALENIDQIYECIQDELDLETAIYFVLLD
jgi:hypothetical protein